MPVHSVVRSFDRLLFNQDGGLPGIPGSGGPSFEKQPAPPSSQPLPGSGYPQQGTPPPPGPPGSPVFQQNYPPAPAPQGGGGTFELSGWWRRVGATIIDSLVIGIPLYIILFLFIGLSASADDGSNSEAALGVAGLLTVFIGYGLALLLYAPIMMSKTNGKTLGKMATGIRVVRTDGAPITFGFGMLREFVVKQLLVGWVGGAFLLPAVISYLWPLWDAEHRAGHDFITNTRVVRG